MNVRVLNVIVLSSPFTSSDVIILTAYAAGMGSSIKSSKRWRGYETEAMWRLEQSGRYTVKCKPTIVRDNRLFDTKNGLQVQESSNSQFSRLEELKRRLEALNPTRASSTPHHVCSWNHHFWSSVDNCFCRLYHYIMHNSCVNQVHYNICCPTNN